MPKITAWAVNVFGPIAGYGLGFGDSFIRWLLYFSPFMRLGEFILGCLVAQIYTQRSGAIPSKVENAIGATVLIIAILSVIAITFLMYYPDAGASFLRTLNFNFGLAPSAAVIIFCVARYRSIVSRFLSSRSIVMFGDASYSIYLLHSIVIAFAVVGGAGKGTLPPTITNFAYALVWFAVVILATLLISLVSYRLIEAPARQWLRSRHHFGDVAAPTVEGPAERASSIRSGK